MVVQAAPFDQGGGVRVDLAHPRRRSHAVAGRLVPPLHAVHVDDPVPRDSAGVPEDRCAGDRRGLRPGVRGGIVDLHVRDVVDVPPPAHEIHERVRPHPGDRVVHGDRHGCAACPQVERGVVDVHGLEGDLAAVLGHDVPAEQHHASAHHLRRRRESAGARHGCDLGPGVAPHVPAEGPVRHVPPGLPLEETGEREDRRTLRGRLHSDHRVVRDRYRQEGTRAPSGLRGDRRGRRPHERGAGEDEKPEGRESTGSDGIRGHRFGGRRARDGADREAVRGRPEAPVDAGSGQPRAAGGRGPGIASPRRLARALGFWIPSLAWNLQASPPSPGRRTPKHTAES